ncbi:MAG: thiamine pyrophosphate-binding protein [Coraliomargaritaceae bacterium]
MKYHYSDERNVLILLALLKAHGIKRIVASPGSANSALVASMQFDHYFEMISCVDERSAAYVACGLAAQTGEPVLITCTGATASRNYLSGLTEAYYRKLPVLAVTSTQPVSRIGHHVAQVIDRSVLPKDTIKKSYRLPIVKDKEDQWDCEVKVNQAILELTRHGGGPAHLDLQTESKSTYSTKELPNVRKIERLILGDAFPELTGRKVAIFLGSHGFWTPEELELIDRFCASNNAIVLCDHTSSYVGKYRVPFSLIGCQKTLDKSPFRPDILIHMGEVSGDYYTPSISSDEVWRVSPDGEIRDTFRRLTHIFELSEYAFLKSYIGTDRADSSYLDQCLKMLDQLRDHIPELPFSNIWLASRMASKFPENSTVHFGILNSLRSWNFYDLADGVESACNVGGFGIDGVLSSLFGASLADPSRIYFAVLGDLAFFYDMNVLGNRHLGQNIRILLVNNGKGTEFKQYNHHTSHFEEHADEFIAASGHYGCQSSTLVRHFAEDLGFEYMSVRNKEEFDAVSDRFLTAEKVNRPMLLEVFTDSHEESKSLEIMMNLSTGSAARGKEKIKGVAKQMLGEKGLKLAKRIIK